MNGRTQVWHELQPEFPQEPPKGVEASYDSAMNKGTGIFTVADAGIYQVEKYFNTGLFGHKIGYLVIS